MLKDLHLLQLPETDSTEVRLAAAWSVPAQTTKPMFSIVIVPLQTLQEGCMAKA